MPNISTQEQWSQNGHYRSDKAQSEQLLTNDEIAQTVLPNQVKSSEVVSDDWSSLTKELIDTLPRVWTRGLLYFLILFAGIVLPWATLSKVDETGSARGRLEPQGQVFKVDAPVIGTVAKVLVKEGQIVTKKQPLLELESEEIKSELQQAQTRLEGQKNRLAQLELIKNQLLLGVRAQQQQNQAQELEKQAQVEQARQNLESLRNTYNLQKEEKLAQVNQSQQNLEYSQTALNLAEIRLTKAQREVQRYRQLHKQGVVPEIKVVEQEILAQERQQLREQAESDVKQAKLRKEEQKSSYRRIIHQAESDIKQAQLRLQEQQKSYQSLIHSGKIAVLKNEEQIKELDAQFTTLKAEIQQSKSQIQSWEFQLGQRVLRAPVSGTLFQLPIQRAGAVVQPSTLIAEIAPKNASLILRAQMATSESGTLSEGMAVKMKFDAYPFQDYGVVEGRLSRIAPTSKVTETSQGAIATFDLEIELTKTCIQTSKGCTPLTPGQTATAEVIVRQRRIIDFILDPFKKLQKGGLEL
ncbi:HlyD family efflux transporter periplasmic adaptor subunit [[Phormidium ambiguum] IAM M-71]|uniref:HlyD family efflux transporter periplasmic adaptor subunit n=1 Tax=[Phormidium ambiguum] IAM M-71 TaxID=454136 RepID=UPI0009FF670F|nr:HlyD family efflux transporter periplasmic adaptor subunit [Phormidium ambiguum]